MERRLPTILRIHAIFANWKKLDDEECVLYNVLRQNPCGGIGRLVKYYPRCHLKIHKKASPANAGAFSTATHWSLEFAAHWVNHLRIGEVFFFVYLTKNNKFHDAKVSSLSVTTTVCRKYFVEHTHPLVRYFHLTEEFFENLAVKKRKCTWASWNFLITSR